MLQHHFIHSFTPGIFLPRGNFALQLKWPYFLHRSRSSTLAVWLFGLEGGGASRLLQCTAAPQAGPGYSRVGWPGRPGAEVTSAEFCSWEGGGGVRGALYNKRYHRDSLDEQNQMEKSEISFYLPRLCLGFCPRASARFLHPSITIQQVLELVITTNTDHLAAGNAHQHRNIGKGNGFIYFFKFSLYIRTW